jgi:hypothetical protein
VRREKFLWQKDLDARGKREGVWFQLSFREFFSNGHKTESFSHTLGTPDKAACQSGNALTCTAVVIQCAFHHRHLKSQCGNCWPANWKWLATLMLYFPWPSLWQTFPHLTVFGILLRAFPIKLVDILHRMHSGILFAKTLFVTNMFAFLMVSYPIFLHGIILGVSSGILSGILSCIFLSVR